MVVVKCLILCSKFAKKIVCRPSSARTRWGSLQRSPDSLAGSWGKGEERGDRRAGGEVKDGDEGQGMRKGSGSGGYPLQTKILAMALI